MRWWLQEKTRREGIEEKMLQHKGMLQNAHATVLQGLALPARNAGAVEDDANE